MATTGPRRLLLLFGAGLTAVALLAGCSDGGDTVSVSEDGDERDATGSAGSGGSDSAYCRTAAEVTAQDGGLDLSEDATSAMARVDQLAAVAPPDLQDDFQVFVSGISGIAELDEDDPAALSGIVELMMDPEFEAAAGSIEQYTKDECDIALGASPES